MPCGLAFLPQGCNLCIFKYVGFPKAVSFITFPQCRPLLPFLSRFYAHSDFKVLPSCFLVPQIVNDHAIMATSLFLIFTCLELLKICSAAKLPFPMTWSSRAFGPDGPWQAVQVQLGSGAGQTVALYPGGRYMQSHILTVQVCNNGSLGGFCPATQAGIFDVSQSSTLDNHSILYRGYLDYTFGGLNVQGGGEDIKDVTSAMDQIDIGGMLIPNVSIAIHKSIYMVYPDGSTYPMSVGTLALGGPGPAVNQSFTLGQGQPNINASLVPGYLSSTPSSSQTPSNSFGLHIGSARFKISGALHLGGYDQNRVIGDVSTQGNVGLDPYNIDLTDIGLEVLDGESPWNISSIDGLLANWNSSISSSLPVAIASYAPYLNLPQSTCDAIAAWLPVTYQPKYGLYFWNVNDPQYQRIISSPSVLSFTFRKDQSNSKNITINVPFLLLNLTLDAPLIATPTQYFPCNAQSRGSYMLGRAFLQAAFIGTNWEASSGQGSWWLAQAPGPNINSQPNIKTIQPTDDTIQASTNDWKTSWDGYWTPLLQSTGSSPTGAASTTPTTTSGASSSSSSSGLSVRAAAGLGVGVGVAASLTLAAGVWLFNRRRNKRSGSPARVASDGDYTKYYNNHKVTASAGNGPAEMSGQREEQELDANQRPHHSAWQRRIDVQELP